MPLSSTEGLLLLRRNSKDRNQRETFGRMRWNGRDTVPQQREEMMDLGGDTMNAPVEEAIHPKESRSMTDPLLRREIKKAVDHVPADRLASLADYIAFLNHPNLGQRLEKAERDLKAGKGVNWRTVRDDV